MDFNLTWALQSLFYISFTTLEYSAYWSFYLLPLPLDMTAFSWFPVYSAPFAFQLCKPWAQNPGGKAQRAGRHQIAESVISDPRGTKLWTGEAKVVFQASSLHSSYFSSCYSSFIFLLFAILYTSMLKIEVLTLNQRHCWDWWVFCRTNGNLSKDCTVGIMVGWNNGPSPFIHTVHPRLYVLIVLIAGMDSKEPSIKNKTNKQKKHLIILVFSTQVNWIILCFSVSISL